MGSVFVRYWRQAEGKSVKDHPVVERLVEIRSYLEKLRPIDKKMQYQLDKLISVANSAKLDPTSGATCALVSWHIYHCVKFILLLKV